MKKQTIFITTLSLIAVLLISGFQSAAIAPAAPLPQATAVPEKASSACILNLEAMVNDTSEPEGAENLPVADSEMPLATYQISGDTISNPKFATDVPAEFVKYQKNTADHQRIWKFITDVIPADRRTMLSQFVVFSDGYDNSTGAVDQADSSGSWSIEADAVDSQDFKMLSTTLIHEFGHMLTLNDKQITEEKDTCDYYMTLDGCSQKGSYIGAFYDKYWNDIYDEWASDVEFSEEGEVNEDKVYEFYEKHPEQFVTDYAATGPEEDIAESWTYFIFSKKPAADTIAHQKILFFYQYPELVDLRNQVLTGLCPYTTE
ncbi:MAG: hypothetical protein GYA15_07425 [Leptolinea sp.]|jgi:hypothetical protein|nr:hypothetical protein [Leptolinea sp.]